MGRTPSKTRREQARRARPVLEGLESRWVLSRPPGIAAIAFNQAGANFDPALSHNNQKFTYTLPGGRRVLVQIVGRGSLEGTSVDGNGALHLVYSKTNSYSKIVSTVHGGRGGAPQLASVINLDLRDSGSKHSLSGIGGSVIKTVNLRAFDLIAGGTINLTSGVMNLGLNSIGPNTQINLRELPSTLQAGQSSTQSSSNNTSATFVSNAFLVQTMAGADGEFVSAGNLIQQSEPGQPGAPPAPPGIAILVNRINGSLSTAPDLLTDAKIFGYDPTSGNLVRFSLDLNPTNLTGQQDTGFTPISVPGHPAEAGVALGRNGDQLVVMVSSGTTVYAYNATTGGYVGSFTTATPVTMMGSTDTLTVLGNPTQTNPLSMIDVTASLNSGTATPPQGNPQPYTPPPGFTFVGGLTGLPGSNRVYGSVAATFDSFQPTQTQLGILTADTVSVSTSGQGLALSNNFSTVSERALKQNGAFVPVDPTNNPNNIGVGLGSVDRSLALVTGFSNGTNTVNLYGQILLAGRGKISLTYPNQITALSGTFRPDLAGSALIDVQGNIQSISGQSADGLVLNDAGNLNTVKFARMSNSTIVGEPVTHVDIHQSSNVSILSSKRSSDLRKRPDITEILGLQEIGPLSLPNDQAG